MQKRSTLNKPGIFILLALILSLLLSACGEATISPVTTASPVAQSSNTPVKITVWSKDRHTASVMKDAVDKFNRENKAIQIDYQIKGDDMDQNLTVAFASKQAPDIFTPLDGLMAKQIEQGDLLPLDGKLKKELIDVYQPSLQVGIHVVDGKSYVIPMGMTTMRLVYNRDLFRKAGLDPQKPPTTFSELKEYAKKITEVGGGTAYGFGLPLAWKDFPTWGIEPMVVAGDSTLTREGLFNLKEGHPQASAYKPAIELFRDMIKNQWVYPDPGVLDNDQMRKAFSEGKIGMFVGASWDVGVLNDQFKAQYDWGVAPLPVEDGQILQAMPATVGGVQWAIWSGVSPARLQATLTVFEFLIGAEISQKLQKGGYINALHPAARAPEFYPEVKGAKEFAPTNKDVAEKPKIGGFLTLAGLAPTEVVSNLILNNAPIDPALNDLNSRQQAAYQKALESGKLKPEVFGIGK